MTDSRHSGGSLRRTTDFAERSAAIHAPAHSATSEDRVNTPGPLMYKARSICSTGERDLGRRALEAVAHRTLTSARGIRDRDLITRV